MDDLRELLGDGPPSGTLKVTQALGASRAVPLQACRLEGHWTFSNCARTQLDA
ncbi:MAG TPA: hypothetical protein VFJ58_04265 [Armatimonadota bacterium]|nr:hypothetical protein [Armatimonadota bacterium]